MDPYQTLGVPPTATPAEVEAAYRTQLRAWHPDLHQSRGPAAVTEAEARTRALNEAIARVRGGWRPVVAPDGEDVAWHRRSDWYRQWGQTPPPPDVDWFGMPTSRPRQPVGCPFCGAPFTQLAAYEAHLTGAHRMRDLGMRPRRPNVVLRALGTLRYVPAWLAALAALALAWILPLVTYPALAGFVTLVLWVQVSPLFKPR